MIAIGVAHQWRRPVSQELVLDRHRALSRDKANPCFLSTTLFTGVLPAAFAGNIRRYSWGALQPRPGLTTTRR